jgi:hypothetical protein
MRLFILKHSGYYVYEYLEVHNANKIQKGNPNIVFSKHTTGVNLEHP